MVSFRRQPGWRLGVVSDEGRLLGATLLLAFLLSSVSAAISWRRLSRLRRRQDELGGRRGIPLEVEMKAAVKSAHRIARTGLAASLLAFGLALAVYALIVLREWGRSIV